MNDHLNKAIKLKDDEFYTPFSVAERWLQPFTKYLLNKKVICPFFDENKCIVKYLEREYIKTDNKNKDYRQFDYVKDCIVVSNPSFSKIREIIYFFYNFNIKFILLVPIHALGNNYIFDLYKKEKLFYHNFDFQPQFFHNDKLVYVATCGSLTNIAKLQELAPSCAKINFKENKYQLGSLHKNNNKKYKVYQKLANWDPNKKEVCGVPISFAKYKNVYENWQIINIGSFYLKHKKTFKYFLIKHKEAKLWA